VLDNRLRVTRFTLAANAIFELHASDIGQVITTIASKIELPDMRARLYGVIEDEKDFHQEVASDLMCYHLRVMPYYSEHRKVVGVVVIFDPQNHSAQLLPLAAMFNKLLPPALENAAEAMVAIDSQGIVLLFNQQAEVLFGYHSEEVVGQNIAMLMPEPYRSHHDEYLAKPRHEKRGVAMQREMTGVHQDGHAMALQLEVHSVGSGSDAVYLGRLKALSGGGQ